MRRNLGIIIAIVLVLAVIIGLSAAGNLELDRPPETELQPIRSSYNSGPTGTRAFYQLLEETGRPVTRWRESFKLLASEAPNALLVVVGPFQSEQGLTDEEAEALQRWIDAGGNALVISRYPLAQFGDPMVQANITAQNPRWNAPPEQLVDNRSDDLIVQPTELTKDLSGLALSTLAARMRFGVAEEPEESSEEEDEEEEPTPTPTPETTSSPTATPGQSVPEDESELLPTLYAPVVHLGDKDGAVLADFDYGKGRLIFLSDPFVIANNGIGRGANLTLALNLVRVLGANNRRILFDEYHHGYPSESNPLLRYTRGTPVPWLFVQGILLGLLLVYSAGKRFARPLPLPRQDRHSPLEFVDSMANLQQAAQARSLALETIYPRFKTQLCRRLGLSSRAQIEEIAARLRRRRVPVAELELRQTLSEAELALRGEKLEDAELVKLVARMRRILAQLR